MDKKIVLNGSIIHENPTGLGVYAINVFKEFEKSKSNIRVLAAIDIEDMNVEKINKYVKPSYKKIGAIARFLWTQLVLPMKLKKDDVVYHPFQYLSLFTKNKQIITIHDLIPLYYPKVAKHQNFYYKYIMPMLLKKAYKIVCISENTKNDLKKFYDVENDKIEVIYNGYDSKLFNKKNLKPEVLEKYNINSDYMVIVGGGYKHKNLEIAIKAFIEVKETEKYKLVIVGGNSAYIREVKELVKEMKLENRVLFVGYVPDKDLKYLYAFSYAFIYPTLYEGFGLPILEASACGTVVLCSNNSSLPEVYGNSALSFNPMDMEDIKEKIKLIIKDKNLRGDLIVKSEENLKRFSWEKTVEKIEKLI